MYSWGGGGAPCDHEYPVGCISQQDGGTTTRFRSVTVIIKPLRPWSSIPIMQHACSFYAVSLEEPAPELACVLLRGLICISFTGV